MPIHAIEGSDAVANLKRNAGAFWPSRNDHHNRVEPVCRPGFEPGFHLEAGEKVFTIGSCFARNIEKSLDQRGFDVVTRRSLRAEALVRRFRANILNNYGVSSILNELRWGLENGSGFEAESGFFEIRQGRFVDIHLPPSIRPAPLEEVTARRRTITGIVRQVAECRVVVMTLGLIEVWFDRHSGLYLNYSPRRALVERFPRRFALHVLSIAEVEEFMRRALDLLYRRCRDDQRILLTVSPVPLTATYTGQDVLVANAQSKAVLRAVAGEMAAAYGHVDYFPSYESVTLSERSAAWEDDQRHVRDAVVDTNVERMLQAYAPVSPQKRESEVAGVLEGARQALSKGEPKDAVRLLEPVRERLGSSSELAAVYAQACIELGRAGDARQALDHLPEGWGEWREPVLRASLRTLEGMPDEAVTVLEETLVGHPGRAGVWRGLARAHRAAGRIDAALAAAKKWLDLSDEETEPLLLIARLQVAAGRYESADRAYSAAIDGGDVPPEVDLEYAEFLIERQRYGDAGLRLETIEPRTRWQQEELSRLRLFVP